MPSDFTFLETKVISIKYVRTTDNNPQINYAMKDSNFKKTVHSSACLLLFADIIGSGYSGQMFAFFIPPETGLYNFKVNCNYFCRYISTPAKQDRRVLFNEGYILFF